MSLDNYFIGLRQEKRDFIAKGQTIITLLLYINEPLVLSFYQQTIVRLLMGWFFVKLSCS